MRTLTSFLFFHIVLPLAYTQGISIELLTVKPADYIVGGNEQKQQIAMTAPVHMEMTDTISSMGFVMPAKYSRNQLPKPNNAEIQLKTVPAEHVAVLRFRGFASDRKIHKYSEKLRRALDAQSIPYSGNFRYLG